MTVESSDPELARRGLYDRFMARTRLFRGELLHEDVIDYGLIRYEVEKAGELLDIVREHLSK